MRIKDSKYVKSNSVNPSYLIIYKVTACFEDINKNLTPVPFNESKEKIKKYEELWSKIKDLVRSITKNSKCLWWKIYGNQNKMIEIHSMIIVLRAVIHENNKYYPKIFLDECLYNLWII